MNCQVCNAEWECCAPGTEAEEQRQGNLFMLAPAPEIPMQAWCLCCAPWARNRLPKDRTCQPT